MLKEFSEKFTLVLDYTRAIQGISLQTKAVEQNMKRSSARHTGTLAQQFDAGGVPEELAKFCADKINGRGGNQRFESFAFNSGGSASSLAVECTQEAKFDVPLAFIRMFPDEELIIPKHLPPQDAHSHAPGFEGYSR